MKALVVSEGKHELGGALLAIIQHVLISAWEFDFDQVSRGNIHAHHGKGQGYLKRAVRWMLEANKRGYDALILVIDEDHRSERVREMDAAQKNQLSSIRRALGVAIRTFDAWMLADEQALTHVLALRIQRQPDPESIADPKGRCASFLQSSQRDMSQSEMYRLVAAATAVETLEARCPKGFAPFARRLRAL
ncbi:MAG: DUF4276 family protein [Pirellulales bacterium]